MRPGRHLLVPALLLACCLHGTWVKAGEQTGTQFPYSDTCVRSRGNSRWDVELVNTTSVVSKTAGSTFCFRITLKGEDECTSTEILPYPNNTSAYRTAPVRCCSAQLSKIKIYANSGCKSKFGTMTVRTLHPELNANFTPISVSTDQTTTWGYSVKWSWRTTSNPKPFIPTDMIDGTTFCWSMRPAINSSGVLVEPVCQNLQNITNDVGQGYGGFTNAAVEKFEVALYDDMITDPYPSNQRYECCPTYAIDIPPPPPPSPPSPPIPSPPPRPPSPPPRPPPRPPSPPRPPPRPPSPPPSPPRSPPSPPSPPRSPPSPPPSPPPPSPTPPGAPPPPTPPPPSPPSPTPPGAPQAPLPPPPPSPSSPSLPMSPPHEPPSSPPPLPPQTPPPDQLPPPPESPAAPDQPAPPNPPMPLAP